LILIILAYCSVFATFHLPNCTGWIKSVLLCTLYCL
jgi:hypothetical protein